ncbi:MAG: tRNA (adenosine(37)-N6)-threonylcarbamoyltransferase complex dimerization subunit type 1 TsaB [Candidatus Polarisedimenticolaceae bacterium]|nr:tRNA (adenosine(37)-N6)-threonylcarbamoyltransferase complex dimerization subunit type 1 TsaB [Candidatus Polarisedimenticolaceae bacterium]
MKLLAIETATEACSAALYINGEIQERYAVAPRQHAEQILPMMDQLLAEAELKLSQLDALAFGRGPGSFTGVRIAAGVIQGAAFGAQLPVVPISTLAALAQRHYRMQGARRILPAFDARMGELYWAAYEVIADDLVTQVGSEQVATPERVDLPAGEGWQGAGRGWATYRDILAQRMGARLAAIESDLLCSAQDVARLAVRGYAAGEAVAAELALPIYLRDQVAKKPA